MVALRSLSVRSAPGYKPCIRGHRITVQEILEWLSNGASEQQILADYPQLEPDDFLAVYAYAAELAAGRTVC